MIPSTINVRWSQQVHSISFHHANPLSFEELTKHVKTAFKDIHVASYDFVAKGQHIIHDNRTLQQELIRDMKSTSTEIILHPKSDRPKKNKVPVIKPTVLRWTDSQDTIRNHRCSPSSPLGKHISLPHQQFDNSGSSDDDTSCTRKDSGVSMEEPSKKKQRVKSADTSQTALSTIASRNTVYPSYANSNTVSTMQTSSPSSPHSYTIHPLEMRRPSTAPSSPITIKLPALSSITSSPSLDSDPSLPPQLAPLQPSPQRQQFYLPGITSPHPSSMSLSSSKTPAPATITTASSLSPPTPCMERSHSHHSTFQRHHHRYSYQQQHHHQVRPAKHHHFYPQQKHSGQFLCEQVIDSPSGRVCGQTFRRSYDLSRHQTIHLKNRPFCYCDQCGKKFTRMDALRRHERVQGHSSKQHLLQHPGPPTNSTATSSHHYQHHSISNTSTTSAQGVSYSSTTSHPSRPFVDLQKTQQARV